MKIENYNELLDKFYAGTASAIEISLLKSEGLINEQDILYAETLREERGQKMDWEFEDFMNDIPSKKVVAFPARRVWMKRILSAAAVVAAIAMAFIFWPQPATNKIVSIPASNKLIDSNKGFIASTVLLANEIKDTVRATKKTSQKRRDYAVNTYKKRPVPKNIRPADKTGMCHTSNIQDYMVIVNGKPITNEAEAIAITRQSLAMVSRNLTLTIDELKPISRIKIKL